MDLIQKIRYHTSVIYYRLMRSGFKFFGRNVVINCPLRIDGSKYITLNTDVRINYRSWIAAVPNTNGDCVLEIGEGSIIGNYNHIYATERIIIGKKVLTADKVYISDNLHGFENVNLAIIDQNVIQNGTVEIGDGSWIGENACVLGVKIGKHCVIGSNAVVTKDIPDYCVAVGVPAKVIKKYCVDTKAWIAVK